MLTPAQHLGGAKAKGGGVSRPQGGQQGALGLGGVGQVQLEACGEGEGIGGQGVRMNLVEAWGRAWAPQAHVASVER